MQILDLSDLQAAILEAESRAQTLKVRVVFESEPIQKKALPQETTTEMPQIEQNQVEDDDFDRINLMDELKQSILEVEKEIMKDESDSDEEEKSDSKMKDDSKDLKEKKIMKDFKFADVFASIEDKINQSEVALKPKDIVQALKEAVEGTKAEKPVKKLIRKWRMKQMKGPMKMMKAFMGKKMQRIMESCQPKKCGAKRHSHQDSDEVLHRRVRCDGC